MQPEAYGAAALNAALQNDELLALTGGTGNGATVDQAQTDAQKAAEAAQAAAAATAGATAAPTTPAASAPVASLPSSVTGTTADTVTCSSGRSLNDQ